MDKHKELVEIAQSNIGIIEEGGDNKGFLVEEFQRSVGGKPVGQAWCCAYVMYIIDLVDKRYNEKMMASMPKNKLYPTQHCQTLWNKSPIECRVASPFPGCLVVWEYKGTTNGHVGIVTKVTDNTIETIEGNTSDSSGIDREGDGIYAKTRSLNPTGKMKIMGFLNPWS